VTRETGKEISKKSGNSKIEFLQIPKNRKETIEQTKTVETSQHEENFAKPKHSGVSQIFPIRRRALIAQSPHVAHM
jgi:hypothetical protein